MSGEDRPRAEGIGIGAWVAGLGLGVIAAALLFAFYNMGKSAGEREAAGAAAAAAVTGTAGAGAAEGEAAPGPAEQLFTAHCGSCHTLEAAGTGGHVGPDLDDLAPPRQQVLAAIENGGATGAMPAGLLSGGDAEAVAEFVASSAGSP